MQKTAQERGIYNKLREWSNVSGRDAEKQFGPKFKEIIDTIKKKDDQIRSLVIGKKLGSAESTPSEPALKDSLKQAKKNMNRREFMTASAHLVSFHRVFLDIISEINSIDAKMDGVHHEFLFKNLTDEQQERLKGLQTRFAQQQALLIKESGVMDFIHNISNPRGRALAIWEKAYPNEVKKFKDGLSILLDKSNNLLEIVIDALSEMATARSVKNIDEYMKGANKIVSSFNKYENGNGGFKEYYNSVLKPALIKMDEYRQAIAEQYSKENAAPAQSNIPPSQFVGNVPPAAPGPPPQAGLDIFKTKPVYPPKKLQVPVSNLGSGSEDALSRLDEKDNSDIDAAQKLLTDPINAPATIRQPGVAPTQLQVKNDEDEPVTQRSPKVGSHKKFYESLQTLSNESPSLLALFIKKYANSIKDTDSNTSYKLLKIVQQIKV